MQEIAPLEFFSVERHGQGRVPGRIGGRRAQRVQRLLGHERHAGAVRFGRGVVGKEVGVGLAGEMFGLKFHPPGRSVADGAQARARGHLATALGQAQQAHPGGVLRAGHAAVPVGFAEAEQHRGIGDAVAVVADGDLEPKALRRSEALVAMSTRVAPPRRALAISSTNAVDAEASKNIGIRSRARG